MSWALVDAAKFGLEMPHQRWARYLGFVTRDGTLNMNAYYAATSRYWAIENPILEPPPAELDSAGWAHYLGFPDVAAMRRELDGGPKAL